MTRRASRRRDCLSASTKLERIDLGDILRAKPNVTRESREPAFTAFMRSILSRPPADANLVARDHGNRVIRTGETGRKSEAHGNWGAKLNVGRLSSGRHYHRRNKEQQHPANHAAYRPEMAL